MPVPSLIPQIIISRHYSRKQFPSTSMRSSSWRKLSGRMRLSPKLNVLFSYIAKEYAMMLTACSFASEVRAASDVSGRHQHDCVTARISGRQHTAEYRGYERLFPNRSWSAYTVTGSKRSEVLEWISDVPYTSHHKRIGEGRLDGTGKWLLERDEYRTWRSSSASKLLLLRGIRMSPHAIIGMNSCLTSYSYSWSRKNISRIDSHRFSLFDPDAREVGVFLLQSSREKPP